MMSPTHCQSTSTPRVQTIINNGDTLIQMSLADAKILLKDILDKQIADSLISEYMIKDSLSTSVISLKINEIKLLQEKSENQEKEAENLNFIINNKDHEIALLNDEIKQQKKEIKKQKILKLLGFVGDVALPVIVLAVVLGVK